METTPALDHRELNLAMELFGTDPMVGAGLPMWQPAGTVIRRELERLAVELAASDGCEEVSTPVLAKRALFERSGHWSKFADDMFPPMKIGGEELVLRPANCPHHAMVYAARHRSYRELPVRLHELAPMFRAERSGVLSGLSRVRQIDLDDTHVFCRPDQVAEEVARALRSALRAQEILGVEIDHVRLSRRDDRPVWLGEPEQWAGAERALRDACDAVDLAARGIELRDGPGEAAFYGPKLDLQVRDPQGHEGTGATVQLDFNQPERFDLGYHDADGEQHRVVMIHRGTVGSMQRVTAQVLERHAGRLPLWLAPVQVCVLPVGPDQDEAARALERDLARAGLRPRVELEGSLGSRIRAARNRRDCLIAVLGETEVAAGSVQVTDVAADWRGVVARIRLLDLLGEAYASRAHAIGWPDA